MSSNVFSVGDVVRVSVGRHAGSCGKVKFTSDDLCYVSFEVEIMTSPLEFFGRYNDGYWVRTKDMEHVEVN